MTYTEQQRIDNGLKIGDETVYEFCQTDSESFNEEAALLALFQTSVSPGLFLLIINNLTYVSAGFSPDFYVSGTTITWLSTTHNVLTTDKVVAVYTY